MLNCFPESSRVVKLYCGDAKYRARMDDKFLSVTLDRHDRKYLRRLYRRHRCDGLSTYQARRNAIYVMALDWQVA